MPIPKGYVPLPGSERAPLVGGQRGAQPLAHEKIEVTVRVRPRLPLPAPTSPSGGTSAVAAPEANRANFSATHGADPKDIALVKKFAADHQLKVVRTSIAQRNVVLAGSIETMSAAFGVELHQHVMPNTNAVVRAREGAIYIPKELDGVIQGVFGLDNRPQLHTHFRIGESIQAGAAPELLHGTTRQGKAATPANNSFSPRDIASYYNFPVQFDGSGQSVAIIELGGGFRRRDLTAYFRQLGLKAPKVTAVSIDQGHNSPVGQVNSADGEVMLDIEVVGAVAPGANLVVYFAPNTDRGFLDAISQAIHDTRRKPSIVSISWGAAESEWTGQALQNMNQIFQEAANLGVTIFCAAGDNGSNDGAITNGTKGDKRAHVDFPASSPYVIACGGTHIDVVNNNISQEVVWNDGANGGATGGGVSDQFALPAYQQHANIPASVNSNHHVGRGVPDVAANASPSSGYDVRVDGQEAAFGGTSAVAPLWAGLTALLNQALNRPVGYLNPVLYRLANRAVFRDITTGNNDITKTGGYTARPGWDACTGLGSPNGIKLLDALQNG